MFSIRKITIQIRKSLVICYWQVILCIYFNAVNHFVYNYIVLLNETKRFEFGHGARLINENTQTHKMRDTIFNIISNFDFI